MKNNFIAEIIIAVVLIALAVVLLNPTHLFMPDMVVTGILIAMLVVFALFAAFVLRERAEDERAVLHRMLADRTGFLVGSAVLILGIIREAPAHDVNVWLVTALVAMILAKLGARIYAEKKR